MNTNYCEQLDDYLDGDLAPEAASRFREHVEVCGECQTNLDAMSEFDGLVAEAKLVFDDWNGVRQDRSALVDEIQVANQRSVASRVVTSVAVVAATIAMAVVARNIAMRMPGNSSPREFSQSLESGSRSGVDAPSDDSTELAQITKASLNMAEDSRYLAEPIESSNPNITIYWLHPTVDAVASEDDSSSLPKQQVDLLAGRTL